MTELCFICKGLKEIVHTDDLDQSYCAECVATVPIPPEVLGQLYLDVTVPFREGDRVRCTFPPDIYEGIGVIDKVHFDLEHGGTPVYPTFAVTMEEKANPEVPDQSLYTESCLELVEGAAK